MNDYKTIVYKTTVISVVANLFLAALKISIAVLSSSLSLLSDGLHSVSDMVTDIGVFVGVKFASKPPDKDHHFGHGKFETFTEIFIALFLLITACCVIFSGIQMIYHGDIFIFNKYIIFTALFSVFIKESMYHWLKVVGKKYDSQLLLINAWHHRSDAFSSLAVIIGSIFTYFNVQYADAVAGIFVGVIILLTALKFISKSIMELSEISPGEEFEDKVKNAVYSCKEIKSYHKLRIRRMGSYLYMDMHILLMADISLHDAHVIATSLETKLKIVFGKNTNILIHMEPYNSSDKG